MLLKSEKPGGKTSEYPTGKGNTKSRLNLKRHTHRQWTRRLGSHHKDRYYDIQVYWGKREKRLKRELSEEEKHVQGDKTHKRERRAILNQILPNTSTTGIATVNVYKQNKKKNLSLDLTINGTFAFILFVETLRTSIEAKIWTQ